MVQYINKSAVVAEINKLIKKNEVYLDDNPSDLIRFQKTSAYSVLNNVLHFIDNLEVKEVLAEQEGICNGIFNRIVGDNWNLSIPLNTVGLKHGNKVKIFIVKEK